MAICRRTIRDYFVSLIYDRWSPSIAPLPSVLLGQILISTGGKIDFNRWQDFGVGVRGLFVEIATLRRNFGNVRSFDRALIRVLRCSLPSKDLGYRDIYPTVNSDAIFPLPFYPSNRQPIHRVHL